ncbi:MAG: protein-glutamine glutaminase family protein [Gemmataceae bacterium]
MRPPVVPLTLALAAAASLGALPAPPKDQKADAPLVTTSTVVYRDKGGDSWSTFGYYSSQASARRVFEHLARSGSHAQVELRISTKPVPALPSRPPSGLLPFEETSSLAKAGEVFRWMTKQKDIAYAFPVDGCYARAQLMCDRMTRQGFKPRKVWAAGNGEELYAKTKNHPKGHVTWGYHVAPVLRVRNADGTQRWYVIDPSLHAEPATLSQWEQAMMRTPKSPRPYLTITKLGEGPVWVDRKRKPGTGYWPGADPKDGPSAHAVATMKKYKPWEGKEPPKSVVWDGGGRPELVAAWDEGE